MRRARLSLIGLLMGASGGAQPPQSDPRLLMLDQTNQSWSVNTAPGETTIVMLALGEHIRSIRVGEPDRYQISVTGAGDSVVLRPIRSGLHTKLLIETIERRYVLDLTADPDLPSPYLVSFNRPSPPAAMISNSPHAPSVEARIVPQGTYKLVGDKMLLPLSVTDDGAKTYIHWITTQSIPAVFAADRSGHEMTVNGYMREGVFTIDQVFDHLTFRIDKAQVSVIRSTVKAKRGG